ncbi:uncharacterized protein F5147DRAFT_585716, partial [Suillus discolor]
PRNDFLCSFWQRQVDTAEKETAGYRKSSAPSLTYIKQVMKSDLEGMSLHHKIIANYVHTELSPRCTCYQQNMSYLSQRTSI